MTKKKRLINAIIFIGGLIVFVVYYLQDTTDLSKVEKKQDKEAVEAADTMLNALNDSFDDVEFEADTTISDTAL